jgi:2',3'-cyclic-nucleotide 2'-phosphodiesterase/3'-nucleotidase
MLLGLVLALLLRESTPRPSSGPVKITILQTSDLHGRVHPVDSVQDKDLGGSLSRVAAAVRRIRAEERNVLLLDSGDTIQGAPEQAIAFAAGRPDPIVAAMNLTGYDAMALGNHEFDFGLPRTRASRGQARFPWLSANAIGPDRKPAFDPYVVKTVGGVRVGILGLTTSSAGASSRSVLAGTTFEDPATAAFRWVPVLRHTERCDLVIAIAHEGLSSQPRPGGSKRGERQDAAWRIAMGVTGLDLLLMGHTHVVIRPMRLGNTWVAEPGRWGEALTRFDVTLDGPEGARRVADIRGETLAMRAVPPDPEIVAASEETHAAAMSALAETLAVLDSPVAAVDARRADNAALDWIHAVQLREGRADLSFAALLPGTPPEWPAGPLPLRRLWSFYPYENALATVRATGRQVREALEWSASRITDPDTFSYDCDTLEGAEYEIDLSRPRGRRVVSLTRDGRPVADSDSFVVAMNAYRAAGGGGYSMWRDAKRISEGGNLRDLLIADARARKRLDLKPTGNFTVIGAR